MFRSDAMIGDTNFFFSDETRCQAEAEIMIAEKYARGRKQGWEAMLLMLRYGWCWIYYTDFIGSTFNRLII